MSSQNVLLVTSPQRKCVEDEGENAGGESVLELEIYDAVMVVGETAEIAATIGPARPVTPAARHASRSV